MTQNNFFTSIFITILVLCSGIESYLQGQELKSVHTPGVCAVPILPKGFQRFDFSEMSLEKGGFSFYEIGDTARFFTRINVLDQSGFVALGAILVAESDRIEVWVDTTEWNNVNVKQAHADILIDAFENKTPAGSIDPTKGILALEIEHMGNPPDVDGNGKIIILILDINDDYDENDNPSFVAGYFDQADQLTLSNPQASGNVADILYLDSNPGDLERNINRVLSTAAHELQHLINFNYDRDEDSWLNEGLSEYASIMTGYSGRGFGRFLSQTNRGLMVWDNILIDYSRVGLWTNYTALRLGLESIRMLVQDENEGKSSAENVIASIIPGKTFSEYTYEWTLANLIDDPTLGSGEFGYEGTNISSVIPNDQYFQLPIDVIGESVHAFASIYFEFAGGENLQLFADLTIPHNMKATLISFKETAVIDPIIIDAAGSGIIDVTGFGTQFTRATLMISYVSDELDSADFFYSASGFGGFATVELSNDDGEFDFYVFTGNSSVAATFTWMFSPSDLLSARVFMGDDNPITIQIVENDINSNAVYTSEKIVPAIDGWTKIDFGSVDITVSSPTSVVVSADSILMGYDDDNSGTGNAFVDRGGIFTPLSSVPTEDNRTLSGTWMIRLLLKKQIEVDTTLYYQTALRGDNWIEFDSSNGAVKIPFTVSGETDVKIYLYDLLGRTVRRWDNIGTVSPGREYQVFWDGKSTSGSVQSTGMYFIRLVQGEKTDVKRLKFFK